MRKTVALAVGFGLLMTSRAIAQPELKWLRKIETGGTAPVTLVAEPTGGVYMLGFASRPGSRGDYLIQQYGPQGDLNWEVYYGGAIRDMPETPVAGALDELGNLYVVGGIFDHLTEADCAILKFSPEGSLLWSDHYSRPLIKLNETPNAIEVTPSGVYVAGYASSDTSPYKMLLKYGTSGTLEWDSLWDVGSIADIAVDLSGRLYATEGGTIFRFTPEGSIAWQVTDSTHAGSYVRRKGFTIDKSGFLYSMGYLGFPNNGGGYVFSCDSTGAFRWVYDRPELGGFEAIRAIQPCVDGGVIVYGSSAPPQYRTVLTISLNAEGAVNWEDRYNPSGSQSGYFATATSAVQDDGTFYLAGTSVVQVGAGFIGRILMMKYDRSGTRIWTNLFQVDGTLRTWAPDMVLGLNGEIFLTGSYGSPTPASAMFIAMFQDTESPEVDIVPGACPNYVSTDVLALDYDGIRPGAAAPNRPTVPIAVLGTKSFDVSRVDPSTIEIAGLSPLSHRLMDVSRPVEPRETECECTTAGADGYTDLVLYFDQEQFVAALGPVNDGEVRTLELTGKTKTGVPLSGSDCVTIKEGPTRISPLASAGEKVETGFAAYPNPFNAATVVSFTLSTESDVRLDVYDVLGRRVATLVDELMPAGEHQVSWDAAGWASGVYFARLSTSEGMMTRKMVLVR